MYVKHSDSSTPANIKKYTPKENQLTYIFGTNQFQTKIKLNKTFLLKRSSTSTYSMYMHL